MKDIKLLHPQIQPKADKLVQLAWERFKLRVKVTMTLRNNAEQSALFAKGRLDLASVNRMMSLAGMPAISSKENIIVTKAASAADSFHGYGLAFDIAITDETGKKIIWNSSSDWNVDGINDWYQVGSLAEECGLEWGGNFSAIPDGPHFQDRLGWTIVHLKMAKIPAGKTYIGLPYNAVTTAGPRKEI
jgi:peptidoglycan L-alanyl-D-glutamate endopeptidase CwlK